MHNNDSCVATRSKVKELFKEPSMADVLIHNDDITPMEAVVVILMAAFDKDIETAMQLMLEVHQSDKGLVGTYPLEEAYERVEKADQIKAEFNIPLIITIDEH